MHANHISALAENRYEFLVVPKCQVLLVLLMIIHCPPAFGIQTEKFTDSFKNVQPNDANDALPPHRLASVRSDESSSQTTDLMKGIIFKGRLNDPTGANIDNRQSSGLVKRMQDLEKQFADLKNQQIADNRKISSDMMEKLHARLDQDENLFSQLVEKVAVAIKKTEGNAQRIDAQEGASKALKDEIAGNRKTSFDLRERLDRDENLSSQVVEKVAVAIKKTEGNAQRIDAQEAASKALKDEIVGNRKTSFDLRERLDRDENLSSQLVEKVAVAIKKTEGNAQRIDAQEAASNALKGDVADNRKISSDLGERLDRDENTYSQLAEKLLVATKKIDGNERRIGHEEAASKALRNEIADNRKTSMNLRESLVQDENISSERFSSEDKKIEDLTQRIGSGEEMINAIVRFAVRNETTGQLPAGLGTVDWKLSGYKSKVIDAYNQTKTNVILHNGPSFYTVGIGYKFGTHLKFNGKDFWVGVHPMKGVYDDFIKWPFVGRLTFSIVDQNVPSTNTFQSIIQRTDEKLPNCNPSVIWRRNFSDNDIPIMCNYHIAGEEELQRTGSIKDDSLLIRFEVVSL